VRVAYALPGTPQAAKKARSDHETRSRQSSPLTYDHPRSLAFAAVAGVAEVLADGQIRGDLQAHLAVARMAEQAPASTPASLLEGTVRREVARNRVNTQDWRFG
jgi:hypothetical protein